MIKLENIETSGWEAAVRGMRNPMNSWDKSDSVFYNDGEPNEIGGHYLNCNLGHNDLDLAKRLSDGGPVHGKFKRMIVVTLDITAPLYRWKEFDTYKVGTVANSCSTMHKIHAKEFTLEDFSHEHVIAFGDNGSSMINDYGTNNLCRLSVPVDRGYDGNGALYYYPSAILIMTIDALNRARDLYLETKDKRFWWQMIQLLPTSYNQKRTVMLNYEVLTNIYHYRKDHKLDEWHDFCDMIRGLPYAKELIIGEENKHESV